MAIPNFARQTYEERAKNHPIPVARELLETIARKQSNLAVSVDVTTKAAFLRVVQAVGPYCCLIKVPSLTFDRSHKRLITKYKDPY